MEQAYPSFMVCNSYEFQVDLIYQFHQQPLARDVIRFTNEWVRVWC
jgi:hypothetical protein